MKIFSLLQYPYHLLLWAAGLLIVWSAFEWNETVDIHLHDTYLVIAASHIYQALALLFLIFWLIYTACRKILLSKGMTWIHVAATILVLALCLTAGFWETKFFPPIKRSFYSYDMLLEDEARRFLFLRPVAVVFMLGQVSFAVNIIGGLIKWMRTAGNK